MVPGGVLLEGQSGVHARITVANMAWSTTAAIQVQFFEKSMETGVETGIGEGTIPSIVANGTGEADVAWGAVTGGIHEIRAVVDPASSIAESNETNNGAAAITVIVDRKPTARLTTDPFDIGSVRAGSEITFDARGSTDPDTNDSVTGYSLDFGDGTPLNWTDTPLVKHAYAVPGDYTVRLDVRDTRGVSSVNTVELEVHIIPRPPVVALTAVPTAGDVKTTFTFQVNVTFPDDLFGVTYDWDFGDGSSLLNTQTKSPTHKFDDDTSFDVTVTVRGTAADTTVSASDVATVTLANLPPVPKITGKSSVSVGERVTLQSKDTTDPDDTTGLKYDWTVNGTTIVGQTSITRTFDAPGTVPVTLTVTDDDGASASTTFNITVRALPPPPPPPPPPGGPGLGVLLAGGLVGIIVALALVLFVLTQRRKAAADARAAAREEDDDGDVKERAKKDLKAVGAAVRRRADAPAPTKSPKKDGKKPDEDEGDGEEDAGKGAEQEEEEIAASEDEALACPQCSAPITEGDAKCGKCGSELEWEDGGSEEK